MVGVVAGFGVACWLGLYLIARDPRRPVLRRTGAGLLGYAAMLAMYGLATVAPGCRGVRSFHSHTDALTIVPALAWTGAIIAMLPDDSPWRARLERGWRWVLLPLGALTVPITLVEPMMMRPCVAEPEGNWVVFAIGALPLLAALGLLLGRAGSMRPASGRGLALVGTLFGGLGVAALLLPFELLPRGPMIAAIGVDLVMLGLAVAIFDAFAEGEALRADMTRSLVTAALTALLFGGQVGAALLAGGHRLALTALLFTTVAAAIGVQVFSNPLQAALDRLTLPRAARVARAELREVADAVPRHSSAAATELAALAEADFAKLVRRAISNYGDLSKLVASPLTDLPAIGSATPLERATELKALLLDGIMALKPGGAEHGTTDEWRYFNALYYPYVEGLRPYRRGASPDGLTDGSRQAFLWLARYVPERTLHNWQNAAAKLIADNLRR